MTSVSASPAPASADHLFQSYRRAIELRDRLEQQAADLYLSADDLRLAGMAKQASLTSRLAACLQGEAKLSQAVADSAADAAGRDFARRLKAERKKDIALAQADAARAKSLRTLDAGLTFDRRTAGGSREIVLGNAKGKSEARVTLASYGALIKEPKERTEPRLRAMEAFDELWHRAEAGLYPEPRFEPAVDTSAGASGVTAHRMDGLAEMQRLTAYIGRQGQALLWMRVVDRQELQAIARVAGRDPREVTAIVFAALDGVAAFYGFGRAAPEVERLDEVLGS
ncbi:hypothetical protein QR78_14350 [Methylobacterium indicum]|uniref:Uncharacterized protein n=1 Tax=Methylobacterium indicum TaxID=1775910 RepID=A0ABR5HER0_9HYPH|nr:hypothetical protein QR78_14350 [Methylobacterium indicum]KMO25048.1 hypothetical protein QR79_09740 [Methylobacterium indicum]